MEQQDKKISQMTQLTNISGDEIVPVVKSGGNYSALVSQIVALARQTMVAAETGKGLSANDFTDAFKAKLEGLSNYDDAEVRSLITAVNGRLDTILGDGASTAIDTFNEIEAFLAGITDTQTLTGLLAEQKQTITAETDDKLANKVDKVSGKGLSANDYTEADKAKLTALPTSTQLTEKIDEAKLALFVDQFNAAAGANGKYDPKNAPDAEHPFYLNTLWLTYEEAVTVYETARFTPPSFPQLGSKNTARTNIISPNTYTTDMITPMSYFCFSPKIEILRMSYYEANEICLNGRARFFLQSCICLRKIIGILNISRATASDFDVLFTGNLNLLEDVRIKGVNNSLSLASLPKLSLASLQYLVTNAANTSTITVTVHPTVYAKLTDTTDAEWYAVAEAAAAKNIAFATTN